MPFGNFSVSGERQPRRGHAEGTGDAAHADHPWRGLALRSNLAHLRLRDPERRQLVARTACLLHRSEKTVSRQLAQVAGPKRGTRKDQGHARDPVKRECRRWIEMVAAIMLATLNRKGRHLSTAKAIALAEEGGYLEGRFEHIPQGVLTRARCDRWMATLGITLRQRSRPEPCVRFEAHESHACWQFDGSISDAHYLAEQRALGYTARDIAYDYGYNATQVNRFLDGRLPADDPAARHMAVFLKAVGLGR